VCGGEIPKRHWWRKAGEPQKGMSFPRGMGTSLMEETAVAHPVLDLLLVGLPMTSRRRFTGTKRRSGDVARDVLQSESNTLERRKAQEGIDLVAGLII
jgi:hypothetical protein